MDQKVLMKVQKHVDIFQIILSIFEHNINIVLSIAQNDLNNGQNISNNTRNILSNAQNAFDDTVKRFSKMSKEFWGEIILMAFFFLLISFLLFFNFHYLAIRHRRW